MDLGALNKVTNSTSWLRVSSSARGDSTKVRHIPYEVALYEEGFEDIEAPGPRHHEYNTLAARSPRTLDDILDDVITFERATSAR